MAEEAKDGPAETEKEEKAEESVEEKPAEKSKEELVAAAKAKGNDAYKRKEFEEAVKSYSEAIALCTTDASLYSNRSAAYGSMAAISSSPATVYAQALEDAGACIRLRPEWPKGYARQGYAQFHLGRHEDARQSYLDGLKQEPTSEALKDGLKDVEKAIAKAKQAAQAAASSKSTRKRPGFKGQLTKLINPLGLSTKGAILYAITVITVIGFFVMFRAARTGRGPKGSGAGDGESNAEL
mmetsp:Transcript_70919/g.122926  ORF Transcript_70919/g.122926 Transcript_70919/m.122926 type:complete len:239 (-) Transcript_70919:100-816(-)